MFKRIFGSKLTVLFLSMALIGFFVGYDYAVATSKQDKTEMVKSFGNENDAMAQYEDTATDDGQQNVWEYTESAEDQEYTEDGEYAGDEESSPGQDE